MQVVETAALQIVVPIDHAVNESPSPGPDGLEKMGSLTLIGALKAHAEAWWDEMRVMRPLNPDCVGPAPPNLNVSSVDPTRVPTAAGRSSHSRRGCLRLPCNRSRLLGGAHRILAC